LTDSSVSLGHRRTGISRIRCFPPPKNYFTCQLNWLLCGNMTISNVCVLLYPHSAPFRNPANNTNRNCVHYKEAQGIILVILPAYDEEPSNSRYFGLTAVLYTIPSRFCFGMAMKKVRKLRWLKASRSNTIVTRRNAVRYPDALILHSHR
jgi:hypothetical protein